MISRLENGRYMMLPVKKSEKTPLKNNTITVYCKKNGFQVVKAEEQVITIMTLKIILGIKFGLTTPDLTWY